jgi:hypothetical protein
MIGYKATDMDGCCRGFKFEVGKTYTKDTKKEDLRCCTDTGFHFCRELWAIERESNYTLSESRLFEVIAGDVVRDGDKYCTNSITILREIEGEEKLSLINTGDCNTGDCNTGDCNTGDRNTGNCNTGDRNTGNWNTGYWNTGNCNTGYFNTNEPFVRMFNKDTNKKREDLSFPSFLYFDLTVWVSHDMATNEEKKAHKQEIEVCGGFLKKLDYKEAFRISWNKASLEEHKKLFALPNWNNEIFKEISGIDAEAEIAKEEKNVEADS